MPEEKVLVLAGWDSRFVAYIVDLLILFSISILFHHPLSIFFSTQLISWLYWTFLEGTYGQSLGKKLLNIHVTDLNGEKIDYVKAGIESFGKVFPVIIIDMMIGLFLFNEKRQRLFNRLSDTIVISKPGKSTARAEIRYLKK